MSFVNKRNNSLFYLRSIIPILFHLFVFDIFSAYGGEDFKIISSTEDKLILRYIPSIRGISKLQIKGNKQIVFEIEDCMYQLNENQPIIPSRKIIINIPEEATATARIVNITEDIVYGNKISSTLNHINADELKKIVHPRSSNITPDNNLSLFPEQYVQLSQPGWFRDQRICELLIFPVRYSRTNNDILICRDITVEVDFTSPTLETIKEVSKNLIFDHVYSGSIVNYKVFASQRIKHKLSRVTFKTTNQKQWFRITIDEEGIYQLKYQQLANVGIANDDILPQKLHIYYGGGEELPYQIESSPPQLREVTTLFFDDNNDGQFNENDALVFYAKGTTGWKYNQKEWTHYINHYTDENIYWLCIEEKPRKEMTCFFYNKNKAETLPSINTFRDHVYEEEDNKLPEESGLDWMWDILSGTIGRKYPIYLVDAVNQDSSCLRIRVQGFSEFHHLVDIYFNDHHLKNIDLPYTLGCTITSKFAPDLITGDDYLRIKLTGSNSSVGFDWYEIEYSRHLKVIGQEVIFYSTNHQGWTKFSIDGFKEQAYVFEITNPFNVKIFETAPWDSSQEAVCFIDSIGLIEEKRYIALSRSKLKTIDKLEPLEYDLEAHLKNKTNEADYIIITHESLLGSAMDKLLEYRSNPGYWPHEGIPKVMLITTQEICDQFSHGLIDPVAIRNFLKYSYENWQQVPSYILLVGAATYDFKDNLKLGKALLVPSFENGNVVSDDWFVNLTNDRYVDMIIGRLPVNSQEELAIVVDKIIHYETKLAPGLWRSRILLAADDTYRKNEYCFDDYIFLRDSEILANSKETRDFDIIKIYLERFTWDRVFNKPKAKEKFLNCINDGALYINYLGHANWNVLAHEDLFYAPSDLTSLHNIDNLPLFYAGTCEVARIDDPRLISMGERLLLYPDGGVIACVGSARWTMHQASFNVSKSFYEKLFNNSQRGMTTIGQALLQAKTIAGYPDQTEVMFLLGDPALRIAIPAYQIDLSIYPDTLSLNRRIIAIGKIQNGTEDFSGYCGLRLYDSAVFYQNLLYKYKWPGKILFEGKIPVEEGQFETSFFASVDTTRGGTQAQLIACAWQNNKQNSLTNPIHAIGVVDSLFMKADTLSSPTERDTVGPEIEIDIAGIRVETEAAKIKLTTPFLISGVIKDEGNGFSNKVSDFGIQFRIDDQILDDFKQNANIELEYPERKKLCFLYEIKNLQLGEHFLSIIAYDQALNATHWNLNIITVSNWLILTNVLNYPNPANRNTWFTFELSQDANIIVKIYTTTGRCIQIIEGIGYSGFNIFPEDGWDCHDQDGDILANGVYLYKVIAQTNDSPFINTTGRTHTEAIGKLVIVN